MRSPRSLVSLLSLLILFCAAQRAVAQDNYEVGPEDVLAISVLAQPGMTGDFTIERDGMLTFPALGKIKASGMTATEFERKLTTLLASGDHSRFYDVNQDFHDALYDASNTEYLAEQTRTLRKRVRVYRRYVTFQPGRMAATIGEHGAILAAIERNDPAAAFAAAVDHVSLLEDDMVDLIAALSANEHGAA